MTFEHRDGSGGGGGSVNSTTDWDEIPTCALAGVMHEVVQGVLGLRFKFGDRARILIQKMDVKNAFREIPVDPDGARVFGYVLGEFLFVDLRLQFGWRGSPGWWGVISAAMKHAQCNITRVSALFLPAGDRAVEHVTVAQKTRRSVVSWPAECVVRAAEGGGGADDPVFVAFVYGRCSFGRSLVGCGGGAVFGLITILSFHPGAGYGREIQGGGATVIA